MRLHANDLVAVRGDPGSPPQGHGVGRTILTKFVSPDGVWLVRPLTKMDLPCRMSIPAAQTLATHGKVSGIIWMKDQRQSRHSGRLHTVRGIGKPVGSAPIFRHTEESRPVLLNAGHIVELSRFRRFGKSPFIDRFMRQRFTRREAIHILDKLLDSLSRPLDHFIERAGASPGCSRTYSCKTFRPRSLFPPPSKARTNSGSTAVACPCPSSIARSASLTASSARFSFKSTSARIAWPRQELGSAATARFT